MELLHFPNMMDSYDHQMFCAYCYVASFNITVSFFHVRSFIMCYACAHYITAISLMSFGNEIWLYYLTLDIYLRSEYNAESYRLR